MGKGKIRRASLVGMLIGIQIVAEGDRGSAFLAGNDLS